MNKYLALPLSAFSQSHDTFDEAKIEAKRSAARYEEDFGVFEIDLQGFYSPVAPIWEDDRSIVSSTPPTDSRSSNDITITHLNKPLEFGTTAEIDDVPF